MRSAGEAYSYDEVPYESHPFVQTHPDRLATVATLFGMQPRRVDECRVLELGCASGGNLVPMAATLPGSTFVGVDLSGHQIADGQRTIEALGLANIALHQASILDVDESWGSFDYVIAHGVYSWVPPAVQDKILAICHRNLSPQGVAYVSYNTYPGWHMRSMIRRMMIYHAGQFSKPRMRIKQARALLKFLSESVEEDAGAYGTLLKSELEHLGRIKDFYLYHEHLEQENEPVYFHEFIERARAHGLRYLGEADLALMLPTNFKPKVREVLERVGRDTIHLEQYMDFVRNRTFRQTLLCHRDVEPNYRVSHTVITRFQIASRARPMSATPDLTSQDPERFETLGGGSFALRDPWVKASIAHLSKIWPRALPFPDLVDAARRRLDPSPRDLGEARREGEAAHLGERLLKLYGARGTRLLELHVHVVPLPAVAGERPVAPALARYQAEADLEVTNLLHARVRLDELGREVLRQLDGSRTRDQIVDVLAQRAADGAPALGPQDDVMREPQHLRAHLASLLERQLAILHRDALISA